MSATTFFHELKRRNVPKVAAAYTVLAWLAIEGLGVLLFGHEERRPVLITAVAIAALGFILILFISWAFEATPEGMKRTENVPPDAVLPTWSKRKYFSFIIVTALLAAGLHVFDSMRTGNKPVESPANNASQGP